MVHNNGIENDNEEIAKFKYKDEVDKMLELSLRIEECEKNPLFEEWEHETLEIMKNMSFLSMRKRQ